MPDPTVLAGSKSIPATLPRYGFAGWWSILQRFILSTEQARNIGGAGVPGACAGTLVHTITGMDWEIRTEDGEETDETHYYELLLDQARDSTGAVIGFERFLEKGAMDVLTANEGWNYEIFRVPSGRNSGVPVNLIYMDAAELEPTGNPEAPVQQRLPAGGAGPTFTEYEVGRALWESYNKRGLEFYNRHPILKSYVALSMLTAEDDYTYELMTQVIPQGLLNLGIGFDREKAMAWKQAWQEAKAGGKLDDIALLWGTDGADFIPFQTPAAEMPFQHASYWYLTMVTANFEMSPFDLGYMTQINTKAGSEATVELSRNKGLRHLLTICKRSIERNVLPEGLELRFPDLDPSDEQAEASIREANTRAIVQATGGAVMTQEEGRAELVRLKAYEIDAGKPGPEPQPLPARSQDARNQQEPTAKMVAKAAAVPLAIDTPETGDDETDDVMSDFTAELSRLVGSALRGEITREVFVLAVEDLLETHGLSAYMAAGDLRLSGMTGDDLSAVQSYLAVHDDSITNLADEIYGGDYKPDDVGALPTTLFMWAVSLLSLMNLSRAKAGAARRLRFELGNTQEHCADCSRLHGQVHTGRQWLRSGLMPQSRNLACHGWQCDCRLVATDEQVKGGF